MMSLVRGVPKDMLMAFSQEYSSLPPLQGCAICQRNIRTLITLALLNSVANYLPFLSNLARAIECLLKYVFNFITEIPVNAPIK